MVRCKVVQGVVCCMVMRLEMLVGWASVVHQHIGSDRQWLEVYIQ